MNDPVRQTHGSFKARHEYWTLILAVGWIAFVFWARTVPAYAATHSPGRYSLLLNTGLAILTLLLLFCCFGRYFRHGRSARECGIVLSAIALATLSPLGSHGLWDLSGLTLSVLTLSIATSAPMWATAALAGMATACTPLSAGVLVTCLIQPTVARRWLGLSISLAVAIIIAAILEITIRPMNDAVGIPSQIARLGPQNVWREAAHWLDLAMPVLVLAGIALANAYSSVGGMKGDRSWKLPISATGLWCATNGIIFLCLPMHAIAHGAVLLIPYLLLIPQGWTILVRLPFARKNWSITIFSVSCHLLFLLLLWRTVRPSWAAILIALYGS